MNQILQSAYLKDVDAWIIFAVRHGGLEICDDETGKPMYTIGTNRG